MLRLCHFAVARISLWDCLGIYSTQLPVIFINIVLTLICVVPHHHIWEEGHLVDGISKRRGVFISYSYFNCFWHFHWFFPWKKLSIYLYIVDKFSSVHSVMSLRPHGLQHARPLCLSTTPRGYSNSCPLSQWCHPTISSCVIPFSSHLQFFPAWGSSQMSQFFASGGQGIGVSASTPVLPMNIQDWFPLQQ